MNADEFGLMLGVNRGVMELHPKGVLRSATLMARAAGIGAVRNPFEPAWKCRATSGAPLVHRIQVDLFRPLEPAFHRIIAQEGFPTTIRIWIRPGLGSRLRAKLSASAAGD